MITATLILLALVVLVAIDDSPAAEQPCDVERARALGHEINNRLTAIKMQTDLRRLEGAPDNSPS